MCVKHSVSRFQEFHTTSAPSSGRTRVCETLRTGRQEAEMNLFLPTRRSSSAPVLPAKKKKKKVVVVVGGGRKREALTRALRHNHDTIKIIFRRLLVARKAIFTPCNRVWLSD